MASIMNKIRSLKLGVGICIQRPICTGAVHQSNGGEGWFSKLLMVRKIEPGHDSHSKLLSASEVIYEMQTHNVKPANVDTYLKNYEQYSKVAAGKSEGTELVGSWQVEIGDQDQFIHVWRYKHGYPHAHQFLELCHSDPDLSSLRKEGTQLLRRRENQFMLSFSFLVIIHVWRYKHGYPHAHEFLELCHSDPDLSSLRKEGTKLLRKRENQFMLSFSFWGHPQPQKEGNKYEMRSYVLKPGTMIEWGNNWARGVSYRRESAVAGFFSQIGQLYTVHHIWSYKDLQSRKSIRDAAWRKPGWDECVAHTVPLIREMQSRWMVPTPFSPIQ